MSKNLKARLVALEHDLMTPKRTSGLVLYGRDETPEQAIARAQAQGMTGALLVVPEPMTESEWEAMIEKELANAQP